MGMQAWEWRGSPKTRNFCSESVILTSTIQNSEFWLLFTELTDKSLNTRRITRKSISWLIAKVISRRLDKSFSPFAWTCAVSPKFVLGWLDNRDMSLSQLLSGNQAVHSIQNRQSKIQN
jgi:hypothetical protein